MLNLPATVHPYAEQSVPPSSLVRTVGEASINNHRATLGRVLFYDRRLSLDNSVSCASCHRQDRAFAEDSNFSLGHVGVKTTRNTVSLTHIRNYVKGGGIFWDGRRSVLEDAVIDPVVHPDEMGLSLESLVTKTSAEPYYQSLFTNAFGTSVATKERVATALGDFIEAMTTFGSRYDQGTANRFVSFTPQELAGKDLFSSRCASCHPLGNFTTGGFANNGLELHYSDRGRAALTGLPQHEGQFRIPSLRQVGLSAPFMHDGRFATLREVIEFYDHGIVAHPNLTVPLTATPMNLTKAQKDSLEAFLNTLTDASIQTRTEFSDPFRTN
jgi:cytochrome c peroxidase